MEETQPTAEVHLTFKVTEEQLVSVLGKLASQPGVTIDLPWGQLDSGLAERVDREALVHRVSLQSVRDFYDSHYHDDTPSPLAARAFREISNYIPDEDKELDDKGKVVSVNRDSWDGAVANILAVRQQGPIKWGAGSKQKRFLTFFQEWLPPAASAYFES